MSTCIPSPYLSKDLSDEVDIGSGAGQDSSHHLHVCQLLFIHGAERRRARLPLCQCGCVGVALFRLASGHDASR